MNITQWTLLIGWLFVAAWIPFVILTNRKTHPKVLFLLFFTEMWERFSYYGMRALLTLYMVNVLFKGIPGADGKALGVYSSYAAMAYLLPVIGGMIADRFFGFRKSVIAGGLLMMSGHFSLAFAHGEWLFFFSLALIIVGNGYFKPNIASYLGTFYKPNDPRKDGAFTIFYMGVNIGAFLSTLTCGYVGEEISWHYGFGLAGIGMGIGVLIFSLGYKLFGNTGLPQPAAKEKKAGLSANSWIYLGTLAAVGLCMLLLSRDNLMSTILLVVTLLILGYILITGLRSEDKIQGQRLFVIVILFFFHAVFWALFEQAGGSLTLFTERNVNRSIGGSEIPASLFQSLNPLYIMLFAPLFSWIWIRLNKTNQEPTTAMKFVIGLFLLGLGFLTLVIGAKFFSSSGMISMLFIFLLYLFHTWGELSLSPVGLSMITKLSPAKIIAFSMGAWFLSVALGNKMAGLIGTLTTSNDKQVHLSASEMLSKSVSTYFYWGVGGVWGAAFILLFFVPRLNKWMNGIH
jgi:POT family proton-dependent oligopeptide transporter